MFLGPYAALAQAPIITAYSPLTAKLGDTITIQGTNFSPQPAGNIVHFGAAKATVITASPTLLTVKVPAGNTYAPITVINTATSLQGRSSLPFLATSEPVALEIFYQDYEPRFELVNGLMQSGGNGIRGTHFSDLDGDGKTDIIAADNLGGSYPWSLTLRIYRNLATSGVLSAGSFQNVLNIETVDNPASGQGNMDDFILSNVNNDGRPDMMILSGQSSTQPNRQIYINTSTPGKISVAPPPSLTLLACGS